jgi:cytidine deaminase
VRRFIQLLFGHPFHTPAVEEMAMHQAHAMALRSSDERRQVGAVIVKRTIRSAGPPDAVVVASGMNEVPRRQGGYYWGGDSPDARDQALRTSQPGDLREDRIKLDAVREIAARLKAGKWLDAEFADLEESQLAEKLVKLLKRTQFMAVSEFMRQVHAEMAAIVDAAMRGVAVRDSEMYVTTFPCHGCAKHIIAAGISKVVYIEPYAKSRAEMLHREEIALDPAHPNDTSDPRVRFVPFTGVAPRQFARLFSMAARVGKNGLSGEDWNSHRTTLQPLDILPNAAVAYTRTEWEELERLPEQYRWDSQTLRPSSSRQ